jgi:hypothetical protein
MVRNEDQSPAPGAMVVLLPDTLPDKPARETIQVQKTGRDGAFLFKNLAPGKYRAFVLPLADAADQGDIGHLRERAAHVEVTEVQPAQTATLNLKQ